MVRVEEVKGFFSVSQEKMKEVMQKRKADGTALPAIRTMWYTSILTGIGKGMGRQEKIFHPGNCFQILKLL